METPVKSRSLTGTDSRMILRLHPDASTQGIRAFRAVTRHKWQEQRERRSRTHARHPPVYGGTFLEQFRTFFVTTNSDPELHF